MTILGTWATTYAITWSTGEVFAIDSNTVALTAAVLSFLGAIIVALIEAHARRGSDTAAVVHALLEVEKLHELERAAETRKEDDAQERRRRGRGGRHGGPDPG